MSENNAWTATWSGKFPNLCSGEWALFHDGEPVHTTIPFQHSCAGTLGSYSSWSFGSDWDEIWESYEDGLAADAWCQKHRDWLSSIADESEWPAIFEAFQVSDWRHNSCGGCI